MFQAFYTPIIRSIISTVSTASGTNHSIVSATFFQRGLLLTSANLVVPYGCVFSIQFSLDGFKLVGGWLFKRIYYDARNHKHKTPGEIILGFLNEMWRAGWRMWHAWQIREMHNKFNSGKEKGREFLNVTVRPSLSLWCPVRHITIKHNGLSTKESSSLLLITNFTPSPHNTFDPRELLCALNTFRKQWKQTKGTLKLKLWQRHKAPGDQSFYTNFYLHFVTMNYKVLESLTWLKTTQCV